MKMTKEQKYRLLEQVEPQELDQLRELVSQCGWRQRYHIQPNMGLLNDPNGFAYYDGQYHLFYQWFPLGTDHGMKYWYHLKSTDLVNWQDCGIGLKPGDWFDSHGAYSGSGLEHDGKLYLMYTGNTRDEQWQRHPYQCLAVMNRDDEVSKLEQPVIGEVADGYTDHYRDPKLWKDGETFYCVIGAQRKELTGAVVVYSSPNLRHWNWVGELQTKLSSFGYMWECPDYFEQNGQAVLLFCPQGIEPHGERYRNIYQSGYIVGKPLALPDLQFEHGAFRELDYGFDFYAPQTAEGPNGRRVLVGWMGLPDIEYPTDDQGWAHCLTLPRELELRSDGIMLQRPVPELTLRRGQRHELRDVLTINSGRRQYEGFAGTAYELLCTFGSFDSATPEAMFQLELRASASERTVLLYDAASRTLTLDRTEAGQPLAETYGTTRSVVLEQQLHRLHVFVDVSSIEVFVNDGEAVLTSRIFPQLGSEDIVFSVQAGQVELYAEKWEYPAE
ncbi:glycoside hydrolase family 32 protein [Paenibacillus kandeliae]|uniref:glycoside hydrolase family 32 protein n=1 Tax=Paenibacillus kandeliae TaxID=3231269 RepID=UPI0034591C1B